MSPTPNPIPDEIWSAIFSVLRRPIPPPTGKAKRATIRQHELAALMRVNKRFYNLCAPLLYTTIITDFLPALVYNIGVPAASPGIPSKAELLGLTKRLFLEYSRKTTPTYTDLLSYGRDHFILVERLNQALERFCGAEADWMRASADKLLGVPTSLISIATGAFLGGQREIWEPIETSTPVTSKLPPGIQVSTMNARVAIGRLITKPHPVYFCQRVPYGPLTYAPMVWDNDSTGPKTSAHPKSLQHRAHIDSSAYDLPVVLGGVSRWYCEAPKTDQGFAEALALLGRRITQHIANREGNFADFEDEDELYPNVPKHPSTHVEIYLGGSITDPKRADELMKAVQAHITGAQTSMRVPQWRHKEDVWRLKKISQAPPCPACSWTVGMLSQAE